MINVAIIEREIVSANYLKVLLLQWASLKTEIMVTVLENSVVFFEMEQSDMNEFDIIFIDVSLNNGVAVAEKLRNMEFQNTIVLISDSDARAIDGYKVNAYRYYLKPIKQDNVKECMDYIWHKNAGKYFLYNYHGIMKRIAYEEIIYFESMKHYIDIHLVSETICIKANLKDIEKQCPANFIRCQRSYIVNCDYIKEKQGNTLKLQNDKVICISPQHMELLRKVMNEE